jgi:transcriptional regulator with XRE-family HTH domain
MQIGQRLKELREAKEFSQGVIEKRTGLLRCYVSRIENGHTVPSVDTLEKWARALEMPLYKVFHDGEGPLPKMKGLAVSEKLSLWGEGPKEWKELVLLSRDLARMDDRKRGLLLRMAQNLALRARRDQSSSPGA